MLNESFDRTDITASMLMCFVYLILSHDAYHSRVYRTPRNSYVILRQNGAKQMELKVIYIEVDGAYRSLR